MPALNGCAPNATPLAGGQPRKRSKPRLRKKLESLQRKRRRRRPQRRKRQYSPRENQPPPRQCGGKVPCYD